MDGEKCGMEWRLATWVGCKAFQDSKEPLISPSGVSEVSEVGGCTVEGWRGCGQPCIDGSLQPVFRNRQEVMGGVVRLAVLWSYCIHVHIRHAGHLWRIMVGCIYSIVL